MVDELIFDFCSIQIYDNYMIVVINTGVNLTPEHNQVLINITETYFSDRPYVYITHRKNSYSVDPKIYMETSKIANLIGFAVVSSDFKAKSNADVERLFFDKPFEVFSDLDDAIAWAKKQKKLISD